MKTLKFLIFVVKIFGYYFFRVITGIFLAGAKQLCPVTIKNSIFPFSFVVRAIREPMGTISPFSILASEISYILGNVEWVSRINTFALK